MKVWKERSQRVACAPASLVALSGLGPSEAGEILGVVMRAWIVVASHPYYALTDDEGRFSIPGVPLGLHTLEVWHERLGRSAFRSPLAPPARST